MSVAAGAHDYHALRIAEVRHETSDAISVAFEVPEALKPLFASRPGQHLGVRATIGGEEQRRSYSIWSRPDESLPRVAIKRVEGGLFSVWARNTLAAGQMLDVLPPTGRFVLPSGDGARRHILAFAAGSGITPVMAMIGHALAHEPETRFTLVYGNRSPQTILFREQLEDLKDRHLDRFTLLHTLTRNDESTAPLLQGRITADKVGALMRSVIHPADIAHVFLCGPGSMIKDVRNALFALGMPRDRVHHEFFAAGGGAYRKPVAPTSAPPQSRVASEAVAEVTAILDGMRHHFSVPAGSHVVDAAIAAGIRVPYSCKGGMCCTCRARVVEGAAIMTTNYSLEPWEIDKGFILTCQAVPTTPRLVIDYDQM
ncbi:MAG: 2Fe-2S iron-sulfur cluster-binding protein [Hyphomicrobiaceae bacterium]